LTTVGSIFTARTCPLPNDIEMLEDLVLSAVTEAQKKAAELAQEEMKRLTGGLSLPFKLPF